MFKRKLTAGDQVLLVANLIPIAGVLFANWDPKQVFLAYCLETIIIGVLTVIKLGIAAWLGKRDTEVTEGPRTISSGVFFIIFFFIHYGLFVTVQTSIFLGAANMKNGETGSLLDLMLHPNTYLDKEGWLMVLLFGLSYAFQELSTYFKDKAFLEKPMVLIMFEPYTRIIVQQVTVILGAFALGMGAGMVFILIFAAAKIYFTVFFDYDAQLEKIKALRKQ